MRIHAIILALNEEVFIANQLRTLYPFCTGISVLSQFDRDWYGKFVVPDKTVDVALRYPDPEGKIHVVVRRWPDEAGARNSEMLALSQRPEQGVMSHGAYPERVSAFHEPPHYFLIVDADEFYDPDTLPAIISYLAMKRPAGLRVHAFNYFKTWNRRIPLNVVDHFHFGFLQPGILFKMRRTVSWNEFRVEKLFGMARLPNISARLWGFLECPPEVGMFHHGSWVGPRRRLVEKAAKHSHPEVNFASYPESVSAYQTEFVPTSNLPRSLRDAEWPEGYLEEEMN